ncbi:putative sulfate/molybdate transporter [Haloplanus pelagicus]|jgi:MFS superfamily sulfate permease-like transporter|uniref:putative sulfate/molybdate transporter n=1 Tax=Haloplanus pelagicus TaxID=2949995 RepID=UPI00203DACA5|nr:putative sulfate/molybdate transporter [Haloplanus sp. HW8-1]
MSLADWRESRFDVAWGEVTGAVGDTVTVLPIVVAVAALTDLGLGRLLAGFGLFQVVWGLYYGHPMSVEPMKALAALVIAGGLTTGEYVAAGLLAGGTLLVVGRTGTLGRLAPYVGEPVVRGIQIGVALILLRTGVTTGLGDPGLAALSVVVALGAVALGYRNAAALAVLGVGGALAVGNAGTITPHPPSPTLLDPVALTLSRNAVGATLGQLAMTVGNAAVATSLLVGEYFDADASPDDLSTSMGVMNLLAVPLGAMPMCHGSGGVAGKYAFGARTATSNLVLGGVYLLLAVVAVDVVASFPMAVLGVVLVLVALELGRAGVDTEDPLLAGAVGVVALLANVGVAFLVGLVGYHALARWRDNDADT